MVANRLYPYFFFYRNHCKVSFLMTLICATLIYQSGFSLIAPAIWLKTAVCGISVWNDLTFKRSIFYFYKNLGIHKKKLYTVVFLADYLFFILLCILIFQFK